ncbi:uncharacterized protein EV420DRAFT_1650043 [Desarmillaria tabescens]|uniref:Uncharacterized protein n=1 Tax=Armillaria tabescens TaxID=1929756 RepID=A0AA39JJE9_ARMTA|nr:uncharacterized protein EV420DRAFT_1650043 [Desarmillaria tabescens]KAK0441538.1 hypothetical protein EV420DRAFT_1650043 [Desarmillaria tabescens]
MLCSLPVPKLKNGPCYQLREEYPPGNYRELVPSRKRVKDQGHLNSILEGELIIANKRKYGPYPTRKIPRKCANCSGYMMLVTNVGAGMKVYSSDDLEFQDLGSQTCNSCHSHHAVISGFTEEELKAMPAVQMILPLCQTVDNGHFIGPGSALSILPLKPPHHRCRRVASDPPSSPTHPPHLALPVHVRQPVGPRLVHHPASRNGEVINLNDHSGGARLDGSITHRGRTLLPVAATVIEISDNEMDTKQPQRHSARHGRTSMPAMREVNWVVHTNTNRPLAELRGKVAILFFKKLDENPIRIDVPTRNNGTLYLKDHKMALGLAGVEMVEEFEVFGFASEDGWTKVRWCKPLQGVEGSPLFMKKVGTGDPGFWKNWQTAALEGIIFSLLK